MCDLADAGEAAATERNRCETGPEILRGSSRLNCVGGRGRLNDAGSRDRKFDGLRNQHLLYPTTGHSIRRELQTEDSRQRWSVGRDVKRSVDPAPPSAGRRAGPTNYLLACFAALSIQPPISSWALDDQALSGKKVLSACVPLAGIAP